MNFIKTALFLSLIGSAKLLISMEDPNKQAKQNQPEAVQKSSFFWSELENAALSGQPLDHKKFQDREDLVHASCRQRLNGFAKVVCKNLNIENGSYDYFQGKSRAPQGSVEALAFRKFVLFISVVEEFNNLSDQDQNEVLDMANNVKPIEIDRLEAMLKSSK